MADENHSVVIPDPASEGASAAIGLTGLPAAIGSILGGQLVDRLYSKFQDIRTNWDQVNSDPVGTDALAASRAQDGSRVYQIYDYPARILTILGDLFGKFGDQSQQQSAPTPQQ